MTKQRLSKKSAVSANINLSKVQPNVPKGESHYRFSFYYLSQNDIFNFGNNMTHPVEVGSSYWTDLLSMLSYGEHEKVADFDRVSKMHEYDWKNSPHFSCPQQFEGEKIIQFRINKQSRVIGFRDPITIKSDKEGTIVMFDILWIDFHHNHCDSEGYGSLTKTVPIPSIFDRLQEKIDTLSLTLESQKIELADKSTELLMLYDENQELKDKYEALLKTVQKGQNEAKQTGATVYFP